MGLDGNNKKLYQTLGKLEEGMEFVKQHIVDDKAWKRDFAKWQDGTDKRIDKAHSRISKVYWWSGGVGFAVAIGIALIRVL